ncbi:MAG: hypothetical protein Q8P50_11630 [Bacillota bacterium]|nr:hypothetical protein [Bacillota bacterium]
MIATPDMARGAMPLTHERCSIIKVNGDYLDLRTKNTLEELAEYAPALRKLLDQVFEDYGLIVSGWSGESDLGLCSIIEGVRGRRFATYWAVHSKAGETAQRLITHRDAVSYGPIDADTLFHGLAERVALMASADRAKAPPPEVQVSLLKRFLAVGNPQLQAHDLVMKEAERVYARASALLSTPIPSGGLDQRIREYEAAGCPLASMMALTAYWGGASFTTLLSKAVQRAARQPLPHPVPSPMRLALYPALMSFYAAGLSAMARDD